LRHTELRARTVELKIRSLDFRTRHRAQSLREPSNLTSALSEAARTIFERSLTPDLLSIRLLGVGASRLSRDMALQGDLFDGESRERQQLLDRTVDAIRGQFGSGSRPQGQFAGSVDKNEA
jgi:hypothetical protein